MQNKYYTPDISEFYVGFEYEEYQEKEWNKLTSSPKELVYEWTKKVFNTSNLLGKIKSMITGFNGMNWSLDGVDQEHPICKIRVKYLDTEDIESLGWVLSENINLSEHKRYFQINDGEYGITIRDNFYEDNFSSIHIYKINYSSKAFDTLFSGKIKNKSELKNIMKMINII